MWVCVGSEYEKIEGLKWMKFDMWYLSEFYKLVEMVWGILGWL